MQLRQLHRHFLAEVKKIYNEDEATVITAMIFESLIGIDKLALTVNGSTPIQPEWDGILNAALDKLKQDVPVQYITGIAWFYNLPFKVSPAVLIPRPETAELVEAIISFCKAENKKTLLDIGTGSGCIPISIKKNVPHLSVSALDVSDDALEVARENAKSNGVEISWVRADFLDESSWKNLSSFDVIVSNPPYIPVKEKDLLDKNVTAHEPHLALFVPDNDPFVFYEKIALFGKTHLATDGKIFMETHEQYAKQVAALFSDNGYTAQVQSDFYGKERMVMATHSR